TGGEPFEPQREARFVKNLIGLPISSQRTVCVPYYERNQGRHRHGQQCDNEGRTANPHRFFPGETKKLPSHWKHLKRDEFAVVSGAGDERFSPALKLRQPGRIDLI